MKLNYNLKKTDTSDAETIKHFMTTLYSFFDWQEYCEETGDTEGAKIWFNKAIKELKAYMEEFYKQNQSNIKK